MREYGKPFSQQVEGLSPFWNKSYAIEPKVQTGDVKEICHRSFRREKPKALN
jgi:hypothetical protein